MTFPFVISVFHPCQKRKLAESDQLAEFGQDDFQDDAFDERWEKEWKRHVFWCAMKQVRRELPRKTVDVFERCDLNGEAPAAVAAEMNVSLATVYNYRSGVLARLRKFEVPSPPRLRRLKPKTICNCSASASSSVLFFPHRFLLRGIRFKMCLFHRQNSFAEIGKEHMVRVTKKVVKEKTEWSPFRVCVLDFSSLDILGQKRFLDERNREIRIPAQSTLNDADRKSVNGFMQGIVRMIDAWDNSKTNTENRRTQAEDNRFDRAKALALFAWEDGARGRGRRWRCSPWMDVCCR